MLSSCFSFGCRRTNTTGTLSEVLHAFPGAAPAYIGLAAMSREKQKKILIVFRLHWIYVYFAAWTMHFQIMVKERQRNAFSKSTIYLEYHSCSYMFRRCRSAIVREPKGSWWNCAYATS
jgi:hypothetical protein